MFLLFFFLARLRLSGGLQINANCGRRYKHYSPMTAGEQFAVRQLPVEGFPSLENKTLTEAPSIGQ
jgi:hypothetical protein